jgi:TRAP-type C4-dicarboxylate transport system permease small subunit
VIRTLERALGWIAGASLFGMMALTFADVIGRKLLDRSIPGSLEVTELLMFGVIFAALPLASLRGEHVMFDLLDHLLPRALRAVQGALSNLICTALLAGGAWLVHVRAGRTADQGDTTAQLQLPMAPWYYAAAALLLATALMHLYLAFRAPSAEQADEDPTAGAV